MSSHAFSFKQRLLKARRQMTADALLIEYPDDLFYLTGLQLSTGALLLTKRSSCLFVDGRYLQVAKEKSPIPVSSLDCLEREAARLRLKTVEFDSRRTSYARFLALKKWGCALQASPGPLKELRWVKDGAEIALMKRSAQLAWKGYQHLRRWLKPGVTEKEAAFEFEFFCRKQGAEGLAFDPIIAFGKQGAMPHHRPGEAVLRKREPVLIDVGVVLDRYRSDMTRVWIPPGCNPALKKMYLLVQKAQRAALACCRPGSTIRDLDQAAHAVLASEHMASLMMHGLGHGIGLETHEPPRVKGDSEDGGVVLQAGMVITIEPGLYQPGLGGVRYEDTVVVTEEGYENFYPEGNT
jgi:Xaa-Pro aminopeptidase